MNFKKEKNKKNRLKTVFCYVLFILFFYTDINTYFSTFYLKTALSLLLEFVVVIAYFVIFKKRTIKSKGIVIPIILIVGILVSSIFSAETSMYPFQLAFIILNSFLFACCVEKNKLLTIYCNFFAFLSVYSIIFLLFCYFAPEISQRLFPTFSIVNSRYIEGNLTFINGFFSNVHISKYSGIELRNYGSFSEPGKYQFFLILAIIIDGFYLNNKHKNFRILAYSIACIFTFSTAGLIVLFLTLFLYFFATVKKKPSSTIWAVAFFATFFAILLSNSEISHAIEKSITKVFSGGNSFSSRYGSFVGNLFSFFERPIFGWGYTGFLNEGSFFKQYSEDNTNTLLTVFAMYGIFNGVAYFYLFLNFSKAISGRTFIKLMVLVVLILSSSNENFTDSAVLFMILFAFLQRNETALTKQKINGVSSLGVRKTSYCVI